ncbi:MAG TPA: Maebl [Synergistaceae bacterium]|nr:Maebl [Synergistaceae bacterium]
MVPEPERQQNLAVLIDADNTSPSVVENLFAEIAKYGIASVKRIYGDWTSPYLKGWKEVLLTYAIHPIQQFHYTVGKNATDSAMIIDAMDLLYSNRFDGFCLVSSDSDYTRLATRLRESGKLVVGIGKNLTPRAFVSACDVFIYTENLEQREREKRQTAAKQKMSKEEQSLIDNIEDAIEMAGTDDDGWARLSEVGTALRRIDPGFDPRSYGSKQLASLIRTKKSYFDIKKLPGKSTMVVKAKDEE